MDTDQVVHGNSNNIKPLGLSQKFSARYLGSMPVSRLYSQTVQPWVMAEIHRKREHLHSVLIEVAGENLLVYKLTDQGQQLLFQQNVKGVTRFAKMHHDAKCFAYLTRYQVTADYQCHVYLADSEDMIPQLFQAIREASKSLATKPGSVDGQSPVDCKNGGRLSAAEDTDQSKSLYEVKYLGRAKLSNRRVTSDYIDGLADCLIAREAKSLTDRLEESEQKKKKQDGQAEEMWRERHSSGASVKSLPGYLEDVAENLITENKLRDQKLYLKAPGLDSFSSVGKTVDNCVTSASTSAEKNISDCVSDSVSENAERSSTESISFEQQKNKQLSSERDPEDKAARSITTDGIRSRRHSSQTEDRSSPECKLSFQEAAHGGYESQDSICSFYRHHEDCRIMVLQIGQNNICLISLDKKVSVLECQFTDISFVSQGHHKQDIFGIVARDSGNAFYCYILRCLSQVVVEEILSTLQTAFATACSSKRGGDVSSCSVEAAATAAQNQVCSTCPLLQFHKICQESNSMSPQAAYELIVKKVHCLPNKEFNELNCLLQVEAPESFDESLEVIMIFLRQLCERKQKEHVHTSETSKSNNALMNVLEEKHGLLEGLKNKAKKSLTTSFEHLMTRGKKKDEAVDTFRQRSWTTDSETSWTSRDSSTTSTPDVSPMPSPMRKDAHHDFPSPPSSPGPHRRRSSTMDIPGTDRQMTRRRDVNHNTTPSPMKTTFMVSTSSPQPSDSLSSSTAGSPMEDTHLLAPSRRPSSSWRKAIFNKVCTPQHSVEIGEEIVQLKMEGKLLNTSDVRAMWRKLILESLLLIRMEKENHKTRALQEQDGATLSHKLEYQELTPCLKEITCTWEKMLAVNDGDEEEVGKALMEEEGKSIPRNTLLEYVKKGVPRSLRGQIWLFLMQQQQMCASVPDSSIESSSYEDLLKQLTMHQHAILIDLGRTFPSHPYFSKSLGAGQLELFNLLKAYSLLDSEVGYCQGLSFIVGMLLMHMEEISAFHVLKYLMYDLGLRKQFRPNMMALQLKLYQLTRLLHDQYKNVYDHFERHEISPTLYAAPWFLTMFASQFPLGFVARVFDMIFIQGIDALFKVALTLIGSHNALILQCDSFESIVDFLKITLPEMVQVQMERIINQAFELDIDKELQQYEVEYYVLSEEASFSTEHQHHHHQHHHHHHHSYQQLQQHGASFSPPTVHTNDRYLRTVSERTPVIDMVMVNRLENQNLALKHQNTELMERLHQAQSQKKSSEVNAITQQIEMDKLKSNIRSLETERTALLTTVAKLRQLVPRESLHSLQLYLPSNSSTNIGLENVSDIEGKHQLANQSTEQTMNDEYGAGPLQGGQCVSSKICSQSELTNSTRMSLLPLFIEAAFPPNKICTSQTPLLQGIDTSEERYSLSSFHHKPPGTSHTHEVSNIATTHCTSSPSAGPLKTTSTITLSNDVREKNLHPLKTRHPIINVEPVSHISSLSSSCVPQTHASRTISNMSISLPKLGVSPTEKKQNSVKVVVQQSTTMNNSQT